MNELVRDTLFNIKKQNEPDRNDTTKSEKTCAKCKKRVVSRAVFCNESNHWIHYNCDRLAIYDIALIESPNHILYRCKLCTKSVTSDSHEVTETIALGINPDKANTIERQIERKYSDNSDAVSLSGLESEIITPIRTHTHEHGNMSRTPSHSEESHTHTGENNSSPELHDNKCTHAPKENTNDADVHGSSSDLSISSISNDEHEENKTDKDSSPKITSNDNAVPENDSKTDHNTPRINNQDHSENNNSVDKIDVPHATKNTESDHHAGNSSYTEDTSETQVNKNTSKNVEPATQGEMLHYISSLDKSMMKIAEYFVNHVPQNIPNNNNSEYISGKLDTCVTGMSNLIQKVEKLTNYNSEQNKEVVSLLKKQNELQEKNNKLHEEALQYMKATHKCGCKTDNKETLNGSGNKNDIETRLSGLEKRLSVIENKSTETATKVNKIPVHNTHENSHNKHELYSEKVSKANGLSPIFSLRF